MSTKMKPNNKIKESKELYKCYKKNRKLSYLKTNSKH